LRRTWIGAGIGCVLLFCSLVSAGFGHGLNTPFLISAAPLAYIPSLIFAAPVLWGVFALLTQTKPRWAFPIVIFVHYLAAISSVALNFNGDFRDPYRDLQQILAFARPYLFIFSVVYLAAQIWLWHSYVTTHKEFGR